MYILKRSRSLSKRKHSSAHNSLLRDRLRGRMNCTWQLLGFAVV